ncbi:MAG: hypothetical protein EXX96DRAFT_631177, partial [Benjaminiella poitrasii]
NKLEDAQNQCIRRVFGGSAHSSIQVIIHLTLLPSTEEIFHILLAKSLLHFLSLPDNSLFTKLLPHIRISSNRSQWYTLSKTPLWKTCHFELHSLDNKRFRKLQQQFLKDNLNTRRSAPNNSTLLSLCRTTISINPILWLPMSFVECSRCTRWRLRRLPNGYSTYCPTHSSQRLTRQHAVICFQMQRRLQMSETIEDPLSFLLNQLPTSSLSVTP